MAVKSSTRPRTEERFYSTKPTKIWCSWRVLYQARARREQARRHARRRAQAATAAASHTWERLAPRTSARRAEPSAEWPKRRPHTALRRCARRCDATSCASSRNPRAMRGRRRSGAAARSLAVLARGRVADSGPCARARGRRAARGCAAVTCAQWGRMGEHARPARHRAVKRSGGQARRRACAVPSVCCTRLPPGPARWACRGGSSRGDSAHPDLVVGGQVPSGRVVAACFPRLSMSRVRVARLMLRACAHRSHASARSARRSSCPLRRSCRCRWPWRRRRLRPLPTPPGVWAPCWHGRPLCARRPSSRCARHLARQPWVRAS